MGVAMDQELDMVNYVCCVVTLERLGAATSSLHTLFVFFSTWQGTQHTCVDHR
jgi:hypothetical protein